MSLIYITPYQEAASEKGILEQSEITLVSLTDTTLQDQETTVTDEEGIWEDKHPDGVREGGQKSQEVTFSDPNSLTDGVYVLLSL